ARASASSTSLPISVSKIIPAGVCPGTTEENAMTRPRTRMAAFMGLFLLVHSETEGAPSFRVFCEIGRVFPSSPNHQYEIREGSPTPASVASYPCQERKDGAPGQGP